MLRFLPASVALFLNARKLAAEQRRTTKQRGVKTKIQRGEIKQKQPEARGCAMPSQPLPRFCFNAFRDSTESRIKSMSSFITPFFVVFSSLFLFLVLVNAIKGAVSAPNESAGNAKPQRNLRKEKRPSKIATTPNRSLGSELPELRFQRRGGSERKKRPSAPPSAARRSAAGGNR